MRRFIGGILGDEFARERLLQDGLAERFGPGEVGLNLLVQSFRYLKPAVDDSDYLSLFCGSTYGHVQLPWLLGVDSRSSHSVD